MSATCYYQYNKYSQQSELKMQSKEEIIEAEDQAAEHIKITRRLKQKLDTPKEIIFILTFHRKVGEQIFEIAKWALAEAMIHVKEDKNQEKLQVKTSKVNFYKLTLHVIENGYFRVIAIDTYGTKQQELRIKADLMLASSIIQKSTEVGKKKIKLFAALNQSDSDEQTVQDYFYKAQIYLGKQINDPKNNKKILDNSINLNIIAVKIKSKVYQACTLENGDLNECKFDMSQFPPFSFDDFMKENCKLALTRKELENYRKFLQIFLIAIVSPFKQILSNVANQREVNQSNLCRPFIQRIKQILPDGNQELERVTPPKNDEQLAFEWFSLMCLKIKDKYMLEYKEKKDSIELLKEFYDELFKEANHLPIVQSENLVYVRKFANYLIQQLKDLQELSAEYLSPQVTAILAELTAKDNSDKDIDKQVIKYKIAENLINKQVKKNKSVSYYKLFENVMEKAFENLKLENTANKARLLTGQKKILQAIPLQRIEAIMISKCSSTQEKNLEIKSIAQFCLEFLRKPEGTKIDWAKTLNIFAKSAEKLKNYGLPELAIELFKKIRFEHMIEETAKDLIYKMGWAKQTEMCNLYAELSEYFENIGNLQKAVKYREMVYENCPNNIEALKTLIEKRGKLMKKQSGKEATLISKFSDNKFSEKNLDAYFNYQFPDQFKKDLENKDNLVIDTEASFEIDRSEELTRLLNFSAQF